MMVQSLELTGKPLREYIELGYRYRRMCKQLEKYADCRVCVAFAEGAQLTISDLRDADRLRRLLVDKVVPFLRDRYDMPIGDDLEVELVKDDEPDVMILDLKMPGIDGIEVLRRVKRTNPHIEVIILTGHGSDEDCKTCMELGAFAYLQKPVDIDLLSETLRKANEKARMSAGAASTGDKDRT